MLAQIKCLLDEASITYTGATRIRYGLMARAIRSRRKESSQARLRSDLHLHFQNTMSPIQKGIRS